MASIDPRASRFSQGVVGVGALAAYLADAPLVLPFLAAALAAGALLGPAANPLALLWRRAIVPALKLGPPARTKDDAPVRFAQSVGLVVLAAASALLLVPISVGVGWALALLVAGLALLAAITDLCVGCEAYVLLQRWAARPSHP